MHIYIDMCVYIYSLKTTFSMLKLCDCVGKSVLAALTAATYFLVLVGMCWAAAS